jgi:hypothetical protein
VTVIAVVGDAATTSAVAIAAGWAVDDEVIVLEADPSGGSLAGWLDTPQQPSLATIVATIGPNGASDLRSAMATIDAMTQHSATGVRFVANAVRGRAAHRAVDEAGAAVVPAAAGASTVVIADVGAHRGAHISAPSTALEFADAIVLVHRQATASAAAATVRIERLVEIVEELAHLDAAIVLAVIGTAPFDPAEIGAFVDEAVPATVQLVLSLADDPLTAATIAGRAGVSAKRLRRLPLMRDASDLASTLHDLVRVRRHAGDRHRTGGSLT